MALSVGIVGLPNVGKSTLFNALSDTQAEAANYAFCTIDPNVGIVPVPDSRFDRLVGLYGPKKVVPATVEFVDIAGLVRGASKGEGKGNAFLSNIRDADAVAHVVRCFEDENIVHVDNEVDPLADIETIETELILKDLETVQKRLDKAERAAKGQDPFEKKAVSVCKRLEESLDAGAFGLSTGLWYAPMCFADRAELVALAAAVGRHDGLLTVHLRHQGAAIEEAVAEMVDVARAGGARLQISHYKTIPDSWGKAPDMLRWIDDARASGVDVAFDSYPYNASCTALHALVPRWLMDGGMAAARARIRDGTTRKRLAEDVARAARLAGC